MCAPLTGAFLPRRALLFLSIVLEAIPSGAAIAADFRRTFQEALRFGLSSPPKPGQQLSLDLRAGYRFSLRWSAAAPAVAAPPAVF